MTAAAVYIKGGKIIVSPFVFSMTFFIWIHSFKSWFETVDSSYCFTITTSIIVYQLKNSWLLPVYFLNIINAYNIWFLQAFFTISHSSRLLITLVFLRVNHCLMIAEKTFKHIIYSIIVKLTVLLDRIQCFF